MVTNLTDNTTNQPFLPEVSVVVPIYNGEEDLPDLIKCLLNQTYPVDRVEYFLVDNRSQDRTAEIIQTAAEKAKSQEITIHYLSENQIQSSYAARNVGIRASKTEIIAFTDADCRPQPNWLYELVRPFADSAVGIVGGAVEALPGTTLLEEYAMRKSTLSHRFGHSYNPPFAPGANVAIRRQAFEQVGLFRPYLTTSGDIDTCWRIMQTGSWQFYSAEKAVIQHRHRKTLRELRKQWRRYGFAFQYIYELHGIELFKCPSGFRQGWKRWLKELPRQSARLMLGRITLLDLLMTPIFLISKQAEATGRKEAKLSEQMRQIEWLERIPSPYSKNFS